MIMTDYNNPIPDDLPACQELLRAAYQRLCDLERQLDEFVATTDELKQAYACIKEEYLALKRLFYGPRRERLAEAPGQQHLFDDDVAPPPPAELAAADDDEEVPSRSARRKGTAADPFPTIFPAKTFPMMSPPRSGSAAAAAIKPGSARM